MVIQRIVFFILIFSVSVACQKRVSNPETQDPIYIQLTKELSASEKAFEETKKSFEEAVRMAELPQSKIDIPKTVRVSAILTVEKKMEKARQDLLLAKARVSNRVKTSRLDYNHALNEGRHWPDAGSLGAYLADRERQAKPRNWGQVHEAKLKEFRSPAGDTGSKPASGH